jgi:hypothetical protein
VAYLSDGALVVCKPLPNRSESELMSHFRGHDRENYIGLDAVWKVTLIRSVVVVKDVKDGGTDGGTGGGTGGGGIAGGRGLLDSSELACEGFAG